MKEFFNSLLEASKERIKNPFIGSFVLAWLIFNWKPILYLLFSEDSMVDKINSIETKYIDLNDNLFIPLGFAVFYIVVLPYIMWVFEELYIKAKSERLSNKKDEELLTIKNKQETTRESLKLENIKADYKETAELNDKINELETYNSSLSKELNQKEIQISEYKQNIKKITKEVSLIRDKVLDVNDIERLENDYKFFAKSKIIQYFDIIGLKVLDGVRTPESVLPPYILDKYVIDDLVEDTPLGFTFTKKGEYFWNNYLNDKFIKSHKTIEK